ncbi:MAG: hypothetical protein ACE5K8_01090 [Candidatus Zixiibacteriota bacterium]
MPEKNLKPNLEYVEKNRKKLFERYPNKFLIVYEKKVVNSFDTYEAAAQEAIRIYGTDADFLIYHMTEKDPLNFIMEAVL